jgi:hypothetical protein
MLNNNSIWATKRVLEQLKEEVTPWTLTKSTKQEE